MATKKKRSVAKTPSASEKTPPPGDPKIEKLYERYSNVDWVAFADVLRQRLSGDQSPADVAKELGWPSFVFLPLLRGRRVRDARMDQLLGYLGLAASDVPRLKQVQARRPGDRIFISYSHKDLEYLERLMVHLRPLEKRGMIDTWVDTRLKIGDKWRKEVENALKQASVGILLISADFLASDFIIDDELPPLLRAAEEKGTLILPVIVKPCRFSREKSLNEFQAANSPDEPLSVLDESEREFIYDTIAQRIEDVLPKKPG
ncbi:MAG: toll/interleukin-1 receptor domain-containing protein [Candidatus Eisenbacteria bacterium]|nr:toll/interleukin-1 receptor domain-containing protein [Candidatus Eisenbacteria bacterium]